MAFIVMSASAANVARISATRRRSLVGLRRSWDVMLVSREATVSEPARVRMLNVDSISGMLNFPLSRT